MRIVGMTLSLLCLFASVALGAEQKPVATCKDGKLYSNDSGRHSGACRGHGGVAQWADGTPVKGKGAHGSYK